MDMKAFRMGRNTTEYYTSFEEAAKAWGCKPVVKKTKDENKLKLQQEKFCGKHKCKACGEPMTWVGGSMMTCTNEKCKGIKVEREGADGNKIVSYVVSYDLLDDLGAEIAENIFS
jgi:hypothetical protein